MSEPLDPTADAGLEPPSPPDAPRAPAPGARGRELGFPCAQCGAALQYAPGTRLLRCPYCSFENEVPEPAEAVQEIDYRATLVSLEAKESTEERLTVRCETCSAEVTPATNQTAFSCPYCGGPIVASGKSVRVIKPRAVLPFAVDRKRAQEQFDGWIRSLWFAPGDLRRFAAREGRLVGLYFPAWTFDSIATSDYTGQRGDYYYVSVPYTTTVNGRTVSRVRRERRVRWTPAAGRVVDRFDDVLVLASRSLPESLARALEPWDLEKLVPYDDGYLAGFTAESYQVDLPSGFDAAQGIMEPRIRATVCANIGGDVQRITSLSTRHDGVTFKHILLPVWLHAYRYRARVFRFLINARTGEVRGERPYSAWKIAGLVALGLVVVGTIVGAVLLSR